MEGKLEVVTGEVIIRLKGNCPSGYRCRTRHPQGPGYPFILVVCKTAGG